MRVGMWKYTKACHCQILVLSASASVQRPGGERVLWLVFADEVGVGKDLAELQVVIFARFLPTGLRCGSFDGQSSTTLYILQPNKTIQLVGNHMDLCAQIIQIGMCLRHYLEYLMMLSKARDISSRCRFIPNVWLWEMQQYRVPANIQKPPLSMNATLHENPGNTLAED